MLPIREDSRAPISRLRRRDLYIIARKNNIPFQYGAPAEVMRALIESLGIDVTNPKNGIEWQAVDMPSEDGKTIHREIYPVEKAHATYNKEIDHESIIEKNAKKVEEIEGLKMGELKKLAKQKGLLIPPTMKKDAIVEAILNVENPA